MSTRTVIEINHDYIGNVRDLGDDLHALLRALVSAEIAGEINRHNGKPFGWRTNQAVRILGQRHHSEPEWKQENP